MESETEPNHQTTWLYAAFVFVLLAALAFAPNLPFIVSAVAVLVLFYSTSAAPPKEILEHQAHP